MQKRIGKMKKIRTVFKFKPFSKKQRKVLNWWTENSPAKDKDGIFTDHFVSHLFHLDFVLLYHKISCPSFPPMLKKRLFLRCADSVFSSGDVEF